MCWGTSQALILFTDAVDKLAVEIDGESSRDELDPAVSAFCDAVVSLVDFDCLQHFVIGEGTFRLFLARLLPRRWLALRDAVGRGALRV